MRVQSVIALLALAVALGCDEETGEAEVELGIYDDAQHYLPLVDGDALDVVSGIQGGYWTMPALRARGVAEKTLVRCLITLEGEVEPFSEHLAEAVFESSAEGWRHIERFPIFMSYEPSALDAVYGKSATVRCEVRDVPAKKLGVTEVRVVLTKEEQL